MATDDAMDVESSVQSQNPYMDVDSRQQSLSQAAINEAIEEARRAVVSFLRMRKAEDIVPSNSRVVLIETGVRLRHAFRALIENDVRAAAVIDPTTLDYVDLLTSSDALDAFLMGIAGPTDSGTVGTWAMSQKSANATTTPAANNNPNPNPNNNANNGNGNASGSEVGLRFAKGMDSLLTACLMMRDDGLHRVPIITDRVLLCILDYSRVLRFLNGHFADVREDDSGARRILGFTLGQLGLGDFDNMVSVRDSDNMIDVLRVLKERDLRAVPVVTADGKLVNVYSRSDTALLAVGEWGGGVLDGAVGDFLNRVRRTDFAVATCRRTDCLGEVFRRFELTRWHRLFIVDDNRAVVGVLSLSSVLRYFLDG